MAARRHLFIFFSFFFSIYSWLPGPNSYFGRISLGLRSEPVDTPLQEKLARLANLIGNFGIFASLFIFVVLLIVFFGKQGGTSGSNIGRNVVDFLGKQKQNRKERKKSKESKTRRKMQQRSEVKNKSEKY